MDFRVLTYRITIQDDHLSLLEFKLWLNVHQSFLLTVLDIIK